MKWNLLIMKLKAIFLDATKNTIDCLRRLGDACGLNQIMEKTIVSPMAKKFDELDR